MARTGKAVTALGLAAALVVAGGGPAQATTSRYGSFNCSGTPLSGYIVSTTTGYTVHSHQNRTNGYTSTFYFVTGGKSRKSYGYQNESWVVYATTISSAIGTCG